ncbi:MAG: YraN family protein [Candidatus Falkowbacteria bacterium]|nr:YraN family protein [Candidatus Falkowbacteria bacterium]
MTKYKQKVGDFGEALAEKYLLTKGYQVIAKKVKTSYQEIDIVAKFKEKLVFVEVKTRTNNYSGLSEDSFSQRKLNNLKSAIKKYLMGKDIDYNTIRLDLIVINIDKRKKIANLQHFKDIF